MNNPAPGSAVRSRLRRSVALRAVEERPRGTAPRPTEPGSPAGLYDLWMRTLGEDPARPVARSLPGGTALDLDAFERRVVGAERRILRLLHEAPSRPAARRPAAAGGASEPATVLLSARNLDSWLVALAALWKRGLVPLLADPDLSRAEITDQARLFAPRLLILDRPADPAGGAASGLGADLAGLHAWTPGAAAVPATPPPLPAGTAIVRLTSGSTGRPRGVAVGAAQLLADARQIHGTMGVERPDTMVAAIPLGHAYGFVHVVMALVSRGTRPVLVEQPLPALLVQGLTGRGPTVMPGTPYLFEMLLAGPERGRFPGLRLCVSAGAPLAQRVSLAFRDRYGLPVRTFYGASECGGISCDRSASGTLPDGCVGTPLDGVSVSLRPERGGGDAGRVVVRSRAVALGYLAEEAGDDLRPAGARPRKGPAETEGEDGAGRFVTGDLGRIDSEGRIHLLGRADRLINVDGRKVNPAEIEAVALGIVGVREAVAAGLPDRRRGESILLCLVARRGLTREAVLSACRDRLAPHKIPRVVEFVEAIPRNARGKTDRRAVLSLAAPPRGGRRPRRRRS